MAEKEASRVAAMRELLVVNNIPKQDAETAAAVLSVADNNRTVQDAKKQAGPIVAWIKERKDLEWFVESKRVSLDGATTWAELKREYPAASREEMMSMLMASWLLKLRTFATSHGYVGGLPEQKPLEDEDFE